MTTYNTGNPPGSQDPRDLFDNSGNLDQFMLSPERTYPDRLGVERLTLTALENATPDAIAARDGAVAAANMAHSAKDSTLAGANIYPDEAIGRAAVADGETFNVQGSGDVAAYVFRRDSAVSSTQISQLSSFAGVQSAPRIQAESFGADLAKFSPRFPGSYTNAADRKTYPHSSMNVVSMYIPVIGGRRYRIKASKLTENDMLPCVATTPAPVNGVVLTPLTLQFEAAGMEAGEAVLVMPMDARYLAVNLSLLSGGFDIRNSISVFELDRSQSVADATRAGITSRSQFSATPTDWAVRGEVITGRYVNSNPAGPNPGYLANASGVMMLHWPVREGARYRIKASSFNASFFAAAFQVHGNYASSPTLGVAVLTDDGQGNKLLDVPLGSGARWACMNVYLPGPPWDIRPGLSVTEVTEIMELSGTPFADSRLRAIQGVAGISRLRGKRWCAIGDSITEKNFRANINYHDYIRSAVGDMTVDNKGISGSGFYNRTAVADTITTAPDVITVFLGTNDWGGVGAAGTMQLGAFGDVGTATVAGCIDALLTGLLAKFPAVPIGIATPIPRSGCWGIPGTANSRGYTLRQLSDLIRQYAQHYSMPLIDLYAESNLPVWTAAGNDYYFKAPGQPAPDGLHPNDAGQAVLARKFVKLIERI